MITLYGLKSCDTCRKALKTLQSAGKDAGLVDLRADPVPPDTLKNWLERLGPGLVNTRSTTWRGLSENERARDPVELLQTYPALIKRPVIETSGALHLGWTKAVQAALGVQ